MHMKKYLGLMAILVLAFSVSVAPAFAEEDENTNDRMENQREALRKEIQTKREAWKKEFEVKKEEARIKFEALRERVKVERDTVKARIEEARLIGREKALGRFDGAIARMSDLKVKVDAQIEKLKGRGVDTASAEASSALAQTKLDEAQAKVTAATNLLGTSIEVLTEENKTELRTLAQETQTLLREAHDLLKEAVKSLREALKAKIVAEQE